MAGFVGIYGADILRSSISTNEALLATVYSPKTSTTELFSDQQLTLSKSYFKFLESPKMYSQSNGVHVWLDGEIYNTAELSESKSELFVDLLLKAYKENSLDTLLQKADGVFIVLIHDTTKQKLHIITDRHGLKPFYLYPKNNCLILAPELKCFSYFNQFKLEIRKDVIDCFLQLEHFLGNTTWFEGVQVAEPSTIYSYSVEDGKLKSSRYWSWSTIKRSNISIDEAAKQMALLLDNACKSRFIGDARIGVALSGGLDSRAILAALKEKRPTTYTFGIDESADMKVARQVAKVAGVKHIQYDTYVEQWLPKRFSGVWKTDGMLNMYHMHYSHVMDAIPNEIDINLSGFLGDVVTGGSYLEHKGNTFLNKRMDQSIAEQYYGAYAKLSNPLDAFFDLDKVDPYLLYNRGRRMIGMGSEEAYKTVPQRFPFMENKLMDFSYSIPDEYRVQSKVYNRALLLKYPEFFKDIINANTGAPISNSPNLINSLREKLNWLVTGFRYRLGMSISFTDVKNWIKEPEVAKQLMEILNPKNAIYANYTSHNFMEKYLIPHLNGNGNYTKQIMGALTMEIWFQQMLNKKYLKEL